MTSCCAKTQLIRELAGLGLGAYLGYTFLIKRIDGEITSPLKPPAGGGGGSPVKTGPIEVPPPPLPPFSLRPTLWDYFTKGVAYSAGPITYLVFAGSVLMISTFAYGIINNAIIGAPQFLGSSIRQAVSDFIRTGRRPTAVPPGGSQIDSDAINQSRVENLRKLNNSVSGGNDSFAIKKISGNSGLAAGASNIANQDRKLQEGLEKAKPETKTQKYQSPFISSDTGTISYNPQRFSLTIENLEPSSESAPGRLRTINITLNLIGDIPVSISPVEVFNNNLRPLSTGFTPYTIPGRERTISRIVDPNEAQIPQREKLRAQNEENQRKRDIAMRKLQDEFTERIESSLSNANIEPIRRREIIQEANITIQHEAFEHSTISEQAEATMRIISGRITQSIEYITTMLDQIRGFNSLLRETLHLQDFYGESPLTRPPQEIYQYSQKRSSGPARDILDRVRILAKIIQGLLQYSEDELPNSSEEVKKLFAEFKEKYRITLEKIKELTREMKLTEFKNISILYNPSTSSGTFSAQFNNPTIQQARQEVVRFTNLTNQADQVNRILLAYFSARTLSANVRALWEETKKKK
jgi:hypothetical protein